MIGRRWPETEAGVCGSDLPCAQPRQLSQGTFDDGSARLFEKTLFEASAKCGWLLHAYIIISNHYHLAVETPEGNLVEGMRWLQGTFGIRFNALREERGHVFQSRYKSLVIEEGRPLLG